MVRSFLLPAILLTQSAVLSVPSQTTISSPSNAVISSKSNWIRFSSLYAGMTRLKDMPGVVMGIGFLLSMIGVMESILRLDARGADSFSYGLESVYYTRGQSVPITLLVFEQVLAKHCCGTVFLCHGERGFTEFIVFGKAAFGG